MQLFCTSFFTLVGVLVGVWATLHAAKLTWQRQSYNEAAARFRAAFLEEIWRLRKGDEDVYRILDNSTLVRQEKEKILLEPFLTAKEIASLNLAWTDYISSTHTASPGSMDNRLRELKSALHKLDTIIFAAKPK